MNLGDRINCGKLNPTSIGLVDRRVQSILTDEIDAKTIKIEGNPLEYDDLANLPTVDTAVTAGSSNLVTSGAVQTAIDSVTSNTGNLYLPVLNPTASGTLTTPVLNVTTISLNGADLTTQVNANTAKVSSPAWVPANDPNYLTSVPTNTDSANIADGSVSNTEFQHLNGVTSSIQTQLDSKSPSSSPTFTGTVQIGGIADVETTIAANTAKAGCPAWVPTNDPNYLTVVPSHTDSAKIGDGSVSNTKFQYLNGVTSNIQTQLNGSQTQLTINNTISSVFGGTNYLFGGLHLNGGTLSYIPQPIAGIYAPLVSPTFTGTVAIGNVSNVESAINANTSKVSSPSWVPANDPSYLTSVPNNTDATKVANGTVSNTEFQYLNGVTSTIQTQLNGKAPTSSPTFSTRITTPIVMNTGDLNLYGGGQGSGCDIHVRTWNISYHGNQHYFYNKHGANLPGNSSYGIFVSGSNVHQSDDRLKHNEAPIMNALETIRKLKPKRYQKTFTLKEADFHGELEEDYMEESGFIAQEVLQIPELAYSVTEGTYHERGEPTDKTIYYLNYQQIFVHAVQAIKELDAKVKALEKRVPRM
jgi:hypothetical protein